MEDILDGLRRIIGRWVDTVTPITEDVSTGSTSIEVESTKRFLAGDEVMIEAAEEGEPNLIVHDVVDFTHLNLTTPVNNDWLISDNIVLRKLTNGMFMEGIYIGNPEVIPRYPAICVSGETIDSEWMTIGSHKDIFNIEVAIHVEASTQEDGYRFLLRMVKAIREGLKQNFYPLVNDYDTTEVLANIEQNDEVIQVADSSIFYTQYTNVAGGYPMKSDSRAIIENKWQSEETRVALILSPTTIEVIPACRDYIANDAVAGQTVVISPHRFIFNTWPSNTQIGKSSKGGSLLQTAVIKWFAWEEIPFDFNNTDPHLK